MPADAARKSRNRSRPSGAASRLVWHDVLITALTGLVVMCRLLTPTEGAVVGETLWIAQLSLVGGLALVFAAYRSGEMPIRLNWVDAAVTLLAASHGLSALVNWQTLDRRAACNMLCEWAGLLATWFLLRWCLAASANRRAMLVLYLSAGTALSGLGIWQHAVSIPETRRLVERYEREWRRLHADGRAANVRDALDWDARLRRLQNEQAQLGIPSDDGARMVWLDRVKNSSEPFGLFALANTLAGLLLCILLVALCLLVERWRLPAAHAGLLWQGALAAPIAYCLLLTKSRTAFVGLLAGFGLLGLVSLVRGVSRQKVMLFSGCAGALVLVMGLAAALTGGLDKFVFSESLKSLRYRGEYWSGSWHMLTDSGLRWLTGVGPGNFRANYLQYKLPESSEEIADPHNFLLDVWANAGMAGVIGLIYFAGAGLRAVSVLKKGSDPSGAQELSDESQVPERVRPPFQQPATHGRRRGAAAGDRPAEPASHESSPTTAHALPGGSSRSGGLAPLLIGGMCAFGAVLVMEGGFDARLVLVGCCWAAMAIAWRLLISTELPASAAAIALAALLTHLLGAGGIEMPAIVQTAFVLVLWSTAGQTSAIDGVQPVGRRALVPALALALGLYLGCWFWGLSPAMSSRAHQASGDAALMEQGRLDAAEREYRAAAQADPLGYEALARLADVAGRRWLDSGKSNGNEFERSIDYSLQAIQRFPRNLAARQAMAARYLERFEQSRSPDDARRAADVLAEAIEFYPNDARLQAACAEALWKAGEPGAAQGFAWRALELHEISEMAQHADKLLSPERLEMLQQVLAGKVRPEAN